MTDRFARRGLLPAVQARRLQYGFGLWIDNGGAKKWFPAQSWKSYFPPPRFEQAVSSALRASDEYVWVYSHVARFFPPAALPPEYLEAIERARVTAAQDG
jgi:hypothetical protein